MRVVIPQIPVGSMPRPRYYMEALAAFRNGELSADGFQSVADACTKDTLRQLVMTGSDIVSDGEITKPSFATYPLEGCGNVAGVKREGYRVANFSEGSTAAVPQGGVVLQFTGEHPHTRQLPVLTAGPFTYAHYAGEYTAKAMKLLDDIYREDLQQGGGAAGGGAAGPGSLYSTPAPGVATQARVPGQPAQLPGLAQGGPTRGGTLPSRPKFLQAVIAPSMISLIYPRAPVVGAPVAALPQAVGQAMPQAQPYELPGYSKQLFLQDLVDEAEKDIRSAFQSGADYVQMDFTEARLALKIDPSGRLLKDMIDLNNTVLDRFTDQERARIGVHTCPGGDIDSVHSADVPYSSLLPQLLAMRVGYFTMTYASETDKPAVLTLVKAHLRPGVRVYLGVTAVTGKAATVCERPVLIRDMLVQACSVLPISQIGATDDCGFSPFGDDLGTSQALALAKIRARRAGVAMAQDVLAGLVSTEAAVAQAAGVVGKPGTAKEGVVLTPYAAGQPCQYPLEAEL